VKLFTDTPGPALLFDCQDIREYSTRQAVQTNDFSGIFGLLRFVFARLALSEQRLFAHRQSDPDTKDTHKPPAETKRLCRDKLKMFPARQSWVGYLHRKTLWQQGLLTQAVAPKV
jgi:hypothetical protein